MRLTVSNEITGQLYGPVEVSDDTDIADLVALLELDCQFDAGQNDLYHQTSILDVKRDSQRSVQEVGLRDNDLLLIRHKFVPSDRFVTGAGDAQNMQAELFRQELLHNDRLRQQFAAQVPGLQQALQDPGTFAQHFGPAAAGMRGAFTGPGYDNNPQLQPPQTNPFGISQEEYRNLMAHPDTPENKKRLSELEDQQIIDEQLRNAYEYTPEVFTTVTMLYINLEINGTPVKAFVDTGAQMTIMSTRLAEKTGLTKLIDKRFIGEARGVGVGKIIGRIHQALVKIETQFIPSSFVVLDTQIDLLIGLDMLKRHQACVDLRRNVLKIADIETQFLGEADIPKEFDSRDNSTGGTGIGPGPGQQPNESGNLSSIPLPQFTGSIPLGPSNPIQKRSTSSMGFQPRLPGAAAAAAAAARNSSSSSSPVDNHSFRTYPENVVKQLMDLGFSRTEVIKALDLTGGNADYAASLLFQ